MEVKRVEREIEAAKDEKGEDWIFNTEYGEYEWIGEGEPPNDPEPDYYPLTDQQLQEIRQQEEMILEEMIKEKKNEARDMRKEKNQERKADLNAPIGHFPEKVSV